MSINSVLDGLRDRRLAVIQDEMSEIVSIIKDTFKLPADINAEVFFNMVSCAMVNQDKTMLYIKNETDYNIIGPKRNVGVVKHKLQSIVDNNRKAVATIRQGSVMMPSNDCELKFST